MNMAKFVFRKNGCTRGKLIYNCDHIEINVGGKDNDLLIKFMDTVIAFFEKNGFVVVDLTQSVGGGNCAGARFGGATMLSQHNVPKEKRERESARVKKERAELRPYGINYNKSWIDSAKKALDLRNRGYTTNEIAIVMNRSPYTIRRYIYRFKKIKNAE